MTAQSLNDLGLRCPSDGARLVYADVHEYRCTGACGGLYTFRLDAMKGVTLTLKEERFLYAATDGPTTTSLPLPKFQTPALLLVKGSQ